jgi:hypothetical protein
MYESDATRFLNELLAEHPELSALRLRTRATWWDKPQDLEVLREREESELPQPSYVYFPRPRA